MGNAYTLMQNGDSSIMNKKQWKALEELANKTREREQTKELAEGVISLIGDIRYLNGCVKRGRGRDINSNYPMNNVFEYIKELEGKLEALKPNNKGE